MDSLLVLTGVHAVTDALGASPQSRPTWVGRDLRALLADVGELEATAELLRAEWAIRDSGTTEPGENRAVPPELAVLSD